MADFTDDFERSDGAVANGWTTYSGTWEIDAGRLFCPVGSQAVLGRSIGANDGAVRSTYETVAAAMDGGAAMRIVDDDHYVLGWLNPSGGGARVFVKNGAGTYTPMGSASAVSLTASDVGEWRAVGDTISFYKNASLVASWTVGSGDKYTGYSTSTVFGVRQNSDALTFIEDVFLEDLSGGDTTPPTLSSPVATSTGSTTGTLGASTDEANGTMYFVGTGSTTAPTKAQVEAGQDHTGTLLASGRRPTLAITSTGAKSVGLTGLSASTAYHGYAMHKDAAGNQSDVLYLGSFTTAAPNTPPTFPGPNIADQTAKRGQDLGTLDVSGRFSDTDALTFSAIGSWPAGVSINSAGVITRAPTAVPGVYSGLQVRATDTGGNTQDSNAFSFTVQQCVLGLNAAGYEIGDGNSAATMAVLASTSLNIAAYLASEWPPATLLASATASTDSSGRLADLGDDDFLFGTLYQVLLRNPADGERWIWTMQAS